MKANVDTVLVGSKVVLVPYRSEHVPVRLIHMTVFDRKPPDELTNGLTPRNIINGCLTKNCVC